METIVNLTKKDIDNITVFELNGELDETNADSTFKSLQEQIGETSGKNIVLVLSGINYMNSKSIGYISSIYENLVEDGSKMYIVNDNDNVGEILEMVGMNEYVPMTMTEKEAIEALS